MREAVESEDKQMARSIVGMYKAVWLEVEHQFSTCSSEERMKIFSFISPLINHMCMIAFNESLEVLEDLQKANSKRKTKR